MILGVKRSGSGAMDGMAMAESTSTPPLTSIVEAFEELDKFLQSQPQQQQRLSLDTFCQASSLVSILFSCLGLAFKFAEMEYVSKVPFLSSIHLLTFQIQSKLCVFLYIDFQFVWDQDMLH